MVLRYIKCILAKSIIVELPMSVFQRLLQLYQNSSKTPFEDFTTEALTGILETNQEIVNDVLKINGEGFSVYSQKRCPLKDEPDCIIDMVFKNTDTLCFLENKIESPEGYEQLERYSKVLDYKKNADKRTYLRYCSKYFDRKDHNKHSFLQLCWREISEFLITYENDSLTKEFLDFLRSFGMGENLSFKSLDLVTMENIVDLISKMHDYLELIKPKFKDFFGEKIIHPDNAKQIKNHKRYVFWKGNLFGGNGWAEIGVGFYFDPEPYLYTWLWSDGKNEKHDQLNKLLNQKDYIKRDSEADINDGWLEFSRQISDFLSDGKMTESIEIWYYDKFKVIRQFIDETSELEWVFE